MKKRNRLVTLALAVFLCLGLMTPAFAAGAGMSNFVVGSKYTRGMFNDVDENKWYGYNNEQVIRSCYDLGLIDGLENNKFGPDQELTIAQAVTLAARVREIYEGGDGVFAQGEPWYQVYFDYAKSKNIIPSGFFYGQEGVTARRCEMAYIFAHTLPISELTTLNSVLTLPDVDWRTAYAEEIFTLYNAGVLSGSDEYGTFAPESSITRAEASAIVSRLALTIRRQSYTLKPVPPQWLEGYTNGEVLNYFLQIAYNSEYEGSRDTILRWNKPIYYYVGGTPSYQDMNTFNALRDKLNAIEGFPGMQPVGSTQWANMKIYFVSEKKFGDYLKVPANTWGYASVNYQSADGQITGTTVLVANEIPTRLERDSIIYEEVIQSMGLLFDSRDYPESVFYEDSNAQGVPAEIDWAVLDILYDPDMPIGAKLDAGQAAAWKIIEKKATAPEVTETPAEALTA